MNKGIELERKKVMTMLLESSLKSIPFNIAMVTLLTINLLYDNKAPFTLLVIWYLNIFLLSIIRLFYSKHVLKNKLADSKNIIYIFTVMVFFNGAVWGASYFIFLPYIDALHQFFIILVLGGMSAGAIASLSIYLPAYYAYIMPMFLPIILYNVYLLEPDSLTLAIMYLLFLLMLIITAEINSNLLLQNIKLANEKDWLIENLNQTNTTLENTNDKLMKSMDEIRTMSVTDSLTGLYNRRHFTKMLELELDRAKRNEYTLNLVLMDIDNFKEVNDTYGHPAGDDFLIKVAASLKKSLRRANDVIFRLGGDEFAAILTNISIKEANFICNEIQHQLKEDMAKDKGTVSIGVISIPPNHTSDFKYLISSADKALYQAKKEGKNRVVISTLIEEN